MKGRWTALATLLVFALFSLLVLLVILTGAGAYRRLSETGERDYNRQTAVQYLSTRFHQGRNPEIQDFEGCQALVFSQEIGGTTYLTRIYVHQGWLMELFSARSASLSPADGEKILEAGELALSWQDGRILALIDGSQVILWPREGRVLAHEE